MTRSLQATLCAVAGLVLSATPAAASWSSARLVSASSTEQASNSSASVQLAQGGRWVIFRTTAANLVPDDASAGTRHIGDVLRKDLLTGDLALVARGNVVDTATGDTISTGANSPSVSADGRYVAFATADHLVANDTDDRLDVYVRDLNVPIGQPGAFTLVSALNGTDTPATFAPGGLGAITPTLAAISADGRTVAFVTDTASDLPAGGAGTSAGQIFIRHLDTRQTEVVTLDTNGAPAGGADVLRGVALSADGSTVVWNGQNTPAQTRFLTNEPAAPNFVELLWRRVADGPSAVTRRVAGVGDPQDPACVTGAISNPNPAPSPIASPCDGPFAPPYLGGTGGGPFALSADGRTVAFVSDAQIRGVIQGSEIGIYDAFVADMHDGVTRKAGVREITREGLTSDPSLSGAVARVGISADGQWVGFTSRRVRFALPIPTLVGAASNAVAGLETYAVDLRTNTMRLVTRAYDGGTATGNEDNSTPTFTADGSEMALQSSATNLVAGDGNSASDAFVFDRSDDQLAPLVPAPLGKPTPITLSPAWALHAVVIPGAKGTVRVDAVVPAAGQVTVSVASAGATAAGGSRARLTHRRKLVGKQAAAATGAGTYSLLVRPSTTYRRLVARKRSLRVTVTVTFTQRGGAQKPLMRKIFTRLVARVAQPKAAAVTR